MTTTATTTAIEVEPLTATIGAKVRGVNLSQPLSEETVAALRGALYDHQVLFFHGANLDIDGQVAFARHFGEINPAHPVPGTSIEGRREIYTPATYVPGGLDPIWHTDHSYMRQPSEISVLRAIKLPASGGDTQWASMVAAYERLNPSLQRLVDRLTVVHSTADRFHNLLAEFGPGLWNGEPVTEILPVEHPLVRVHPETGRRSLFLNPQNGRQYVKGLQRHESEALLELLLAHITRPEHVVRFHWKVGTVAMWDNQVTLHYPVADYADANDRRVERVSLYGTDVIGVKEATPWP